MGMAVALHGHEHLFCTPAASTTEKPPGGFRQPGTQADGEERRLLVLPQQAPITPSFHKQNSH